MEKPEVEYVSLHNHSHYSLLDGLATTDEYLNTAVDLGMRGFGLTDHGNVGGVYSLLKKARDLDISAIPGCEMYVAPENPLGAKVKERVFYGRGGNQDKNFDVSGRGAYLHLTMWAYNNVGLHNLYKLSTLSWQQEHYYSKNRIDFEMMAQHSEGIIVSTGCPSSEISTRFLMGQDDKAYEYAQRLREVYGDNLYVEVMDHNMSISLERDLLPKQLKLAKDLGLPLLATNDCHYAKKEDGKVHEEFLCIQSGSVMSDKTYDEGGGRFAFNGREYYLKSASEMAKIFPDEDFPGALKNTLVIAEQAKDVVTDFDPHLKPRAHIPQEFEGERDYFVHLINEGMSKRYPQGHPDREEAERRVAKEFKVIESSDFIGYFLTIGGILNKTREEYATRNKHGEIVALPIGVGRGSVGGSIIAFLMGISEVDPIKHDLIFERFLTDGRGPIYKITYEDGTSETIVASGEFDVKEENAEDVRYAWQLEKGDVISKKEETQEQD